MDIDEARAAAVAAGCGASVYTDAAALIADPAVEAVLIASPDAFHAEQAIACIDAGKPVLCEKPMATSVADGARVLQAEAAAGRRLVQVGFMRVYDQTHADLRDLLARGEIGRALSFRGQHVNPLRRRATIDEAIVNSLIHDIHSARWLMGAEISQVFVQWVPSAPEQSRSARYAIVQLAFADGAIGTLEWNGDSGYGYEIVVEITGETGSARTVSHGSPVLRQGSKVSQAVTPDWPQRFSRAYIDEVQIWVDAVREGEPNGPSAWDGYMSLVVADTCIRSVESGLPEKAAGMERPALYNPR
ncbi:MAG: inositol 2-dehydrogenase [Chloroflexi bacterium]|nr:inositol 2-dehydrogenase [Chloroflexota bacterium]